MPLKNTITYPTISSLRCPAWPKRVSTVNRTVGHSLTHSLTHLLLTHSILINLFIKAWSKIFPLPPMLSIVFVPEHGEPGHKLVEDLYCVEVGHVGFMWFTVVHMEILACGLWLTHRWKLREVFMTVAMCGSQQHGLRCQRINARQKVAKVISLTIQT